MFIRSFSYWFACSVAAAIAVGASEPTADLTLTGAVVSSIAPVPEPSRALLLFAGIMAMAFTYRSAWLSWKRAA